MNKKKTVTKYMALYMSLGMCFGVSVGMVFGMVLYPGNVFRGTFYTVDKNGNEKGYHVTKKIMKKNKFAAGDRVAEEKNGSLVSLEDI